MPDRVNVIRPNGTVTSVDRATAERLKALGYRIEEPEQQEQRLVDKANKEYWESTGQKAVAGLEGVASGLSLGIADPLMDDDSTRKRAEYNPGTRIGGEIIGALIP